MAISSNRAIHCELVWQIGVDCNVVDVKGDCRVALSELRNKSVKKGKLLYSD